MGLTSNHRCLVTPPVVVLETNLVQISHMGKKCSFWISHNSHPHNAELCLNNKLLFGYFDCLYYEYMMKFYTQSTWHLLFPFPLLPPVWGSVLIKAENISHLLEHRDVEQRKIAEGEKWLGRRPVMWGTMMQAKS